MEFYNATNGGTAPGQWFVGLQWGNPTVPICSWPHVTCVANNGSATSGVEAIQLNSIAGMAGTLPPSLALLTSLRSLDLGPNPGLSGTLPSTLAAWTALSYLGKHQQHAPRLAFLLLDDRHKQDVNQRHD